MILRYGQRGHCGLFWVKPNYTVLQLGTHTGEARVYEPAAENSPTKVEFRPVRVMFTKNCSAQLFFLEITERILVGMTRNF